MDYVKTVMDNATKSDLYKILDYGLEQLSKRDLKLTKRLIQKHAKDTNTNIPKLTKMENWMERELIKRKADITPRNLAIEAMVKFSSGSGVIGTLIDRAQRQKKTISQRMRRHGVIKARPRKAKNNKNKLPEQEKINETNKIQNT